MSEPATANSAFASLPQRVDRKTAADIVTRNFFPISSRTLEVWPLTWLLTNGRASCVTAELLAVAQAKLDAAPTLHSNRRKPQSARAD